MSALRGFSSDFVVGCALGFAFGVALRDIPCARFLCGAERARDFPGAVARMVALLHAVLRHRRNPENRADRQDLLPAADGRRVRGHSHLAGEIQRSRPVPGTRPGDLLPENPAAGGRSRCSTGLRQALSEAGRC